MNTTTIFQVIVTRVNTHGKLGGDGSSVVVARFDSLQDVYKINKFIWKGIYGTDATFNPEIVRRLAKLIKVRSQQILEKLSTHIIFTDIARLVFRLDFFYDLKNYNLNQDELYLNEMHLQMCSHSFRTEAHEDAPGRYMVDSNKEYFEKQIKKTLPNVPIHLL